MDKTVIKRNKRHRMIRSKVIGTAGRPRLSVYRGNRHIYIQLIDDTKGRTIVGLSDKNQEGTAGRQRAASVAKALATRAKELNITALVFDRGGFKYHGQVKVIADTLRQSGLTV